MVEAAVDFADVGCRIRIARINHPPFADRAAHALKNKSHFRKLPYTAAEFRGRNSS